ncbi:MAG: hypothetical protein HFH14_08180 [Lachnospiraceae bacterium]|nr:hypothetical protein [Lachnospiraceae bacterium]
MSNVIKPVYFNVDRTSKKVIETDHILKELPEFSEKKEMPEGFEFVPGINVINIDDIIEEQKNNVEINASGIIADARSQAERILEEARAEAEKIKSAAGEEGYNNGYNDGLAKASEELAAMKQELSDREAVMQQEYNDIINEIEPQFAVIMGELIEKITGVVIEGTDVLHYLIDRTVKDMPVSDAYYVHISPDDFAALAPYKEKLEECVPEGAIFDIVEDAALTRNKCVVETSTHMIDCSLDTQLMNLKQELRLLSIS